MGAREDYADHDLPPPRHRPDRLVEVVLGVLLFLGFLLVLVAIR